MFVFDELSGRHKISRKRVSVAVVVVVEGAIGGSLLSASPLLFGGCFVSLCSLEEPLVQHVHTTATVGLSSTSSPFPLYVHLLQILFFHPWLYSTSLSPPTN